MSGMRSPALGRGARGIDQRLGSFLIARDSTHQTSRPQAASGEAVLGPLRARDSNLWVRDADDFYLEPGWCSARLFEQEHFEGSICDPACGIGRILDAAKSAGFKAFGFDKVRRSDWCVWTKDFTSPEWDDPTWRPDNIVSNPPFGLCDSKKGKPGFVELALSRVRDKVALLLPTIWVHGDVRSRWLETTPLFRVLAIAPRPSMPPGAVIAAGRKPGNGSKDYSWLIWRRGYGGKPEFGWLRRDP